MRGGQLARRARAGEEGAGVAAKALCEHDRTRLALGGAAGGGGFASFGSFGGGESVPDGLQSRAAVLGPVAAR